MDPPWSPVDPPWSPVDPPWCPVDPPWSPVDPPWSPVDPPWCPVDPPWCPVDLPWSPLDPPWSSAPWEISCTISNYAFALIVFVFDMGGFVVGDSGTFRSEAACAKRRVFLRIIATATSQIVVCDLNPLQVFISFDCVCVCVCVCVCETQMIQAVVW